MRIYKELVFAGKKLALDEFKRIAPSSDGGDWNYIESNGMIRNIN